MSESKTIRWRWDHDTGTQPLFFLDLENNPPFFCLRIGFLPPTLLYSALVAYIDRTKRAAFDCWVVVSF